MLKNQEIIDQMTLEEKASLMSGKNFWNTQDIERLNIPSIMLTDGPHGLRKQGGKADHLGLNKSIPSTCFPTAATLANSWDESLLHDVGYYIGSEAVDENVSVLLGPGLNIKRNPLGGRNFEYFSEDPFLSGKLAASMTRGIQSNGISACPKHFAVNSQEHLRMTIDEIVDERALHEIYLEGFRLAVEEGEPKTLMSAYNKVNGEYANEHLYLMQEVLYHQWNYEGVVVTDWGGNNDRIKGLLAGNQLEMPSTGGITDQEIVHAIKSNELEEDVLDQSVDRLLTLIFDTRSADTKKAVETKHHHEAAVEAAKRSMVLLKNEQDILPLQSGQTIAIIGDFADVPRYQGAGSSLVQPTRLPSPWEALQKTSLTLSGYAKGFKRFGGSSTKLKQEAAALAKESDIVLLFLGLDEGSEAEGIDRSDMKLGNNQLELVEELTNIHDNVIVILSGGSIVEMPFASKVQGIIHAYLGGQGMGEALSDILEGGYNPGGKLAETYPVHYSDVPSAPYYPGREATAEHRESIYIGYRYFDTKDIPVLFPFGYGLSYTSFEYSQMHVSSTHISLTIKNTGSRAGEEVAQLYVEPLDSHIFRARKELKGFVKVHLEPEEAKEVTIPFTENQAAYYNPAMQAWSLESGRYTLNIGSSIQDIRLSHTITIEGDDHAPPYNKEKLPSYCKADVHHIRDEEFHALLGHTPPASKWNRKKNLDHNDTLAQMKYKKGLGQMIYLLIVSIKKGLMAANKPLQANNTMFIMNMTFRQIPRFTSGKVSKKTVSRVLKIINLG
ncbi:beta-glucosidase family protein [Marinococcus luteus]|uniref:beta-glucosidase family protein n=1 Tax=Marinococcus luteus TaxID=1122204 RepID=UPI002ACCECA6|nr:glycoside hydrolase family 3 C-terminal domain-containing protein [Marinococcus luteus]MDZ5781969.1 glycoside hydrolase family 3 C-terminal domain-containing protein [Marinococcus luteus]